MPYALMPDPNAFPRTGLTGVVERVQEVSSRRGMQSRRLCGSLSKASCFSAMLQIKSSNSEFSIFNRKFCAY